MAQYLDKTGLTTLWNKIKNTFALKSHTHTKSQIKDFPTIPTVNNPTITINQGGTKKGSFSLNQSGATTIDLTDNNTTYTAGTGLSLSNGAFSVKTGYTTSGKNYKVTTDSNGNLYVNVPWNNDTWRPVVDNLTTTDATKSLSANQGKVLKDLVDGKSDSSHTHTSLNTAFAFNNRDMPQEATNLSATTTAHTINFYRNALSIPYQMDNANDGGILRCRGNSESNVIFELATWDDSGAGETIQFNYYPTTSQVTPTYSVSVPKKTGTIALTSDIPTSLPASDVYSWAKASSKPSYSWSEITSKPNILPYTPLNGGLRTVTSTTTWGNQTGSETASFSDDAGGGLKFRKNCPSNGKMSMIIDGTVYVNEGANKVIDTSNISMSFSNGVLTITYNV